ncbi:hypothetical protein D7X33_30580 [Butyricicoccus sp. 1XD8-22]|nr:hypothetical protein D7X33_30580 [Butyricicoccus sp. 1XD8-22]
MADSSSKYSFLEHLSVERLEELLDSAVNTNEEENSEYIDKILEVIVKKEKETPTGRITDVDQAWKDFQTYYNTEDGRGQTLYFVEEQKQSVEIVATKHITLRKMWKTALMVATVAICLLLSIVAAQAAGIDVLGAIAQWTDDVFSFGNIQSKTEDTSFSETTASPAEESAKPVVVARTSQELTYASFQDALDAYSITEITEPTSLPDGYMLDRICGLDSDIPSLDARYLNGKDVLSISIIPHHDNPSGHVEKTSEPVEVFEMGNTKFYLLENIENYAVVWLTKHYECFVSAPLSIERSVLKDIVYSMSDC